MWMLTNTSEPVRTRNPAASKDAELKEAEAKPLGRETFRLLDVYPSPDPHRGHKDGGEGFSQARSERPPHQPHRAGDDRLELRQVIVTPKVRYKLCIRVVDGSIRFERQEMNRFRFWRAIPELEGKFLRVITLEDKVTIHNAFLDRRFKP